MYMKANIREEHSKFTILVPDIGVAHKTKNIIVNIVRACREGDLEYIKGVIAKCIMSRAVEGDTAVDILNYLPTGEVVNAGVRTKDICWVLARRFRFRSCFQVPKS